MERCARFWILYVGFGAWIATTRAQLQAHCPVYVEEGLDLRCNCKYRTPIPPPYPPNFSWVGVSNTADLEKLKVTREDNGTVFTCRMALGPEVFFVNYTLQVAYGPDDSDIIITPQPPIILDPSDPTVTLTCEVTQVNPQPTITWTGLTCEQGNHGNTCTLTPTLRGDQNKVVTCSVKNNQVTSSSEFTASKSLTLVFYYATTSSSTITTVTTTKTTTEKITSSSSSSTIIGTSRSTSKTDSSISSPSPSSQHTTATTADGITTSDDVTPTQENVTPTGADVSTPTGEVSTTPGDVIISDDYVFPLAVFAGCMAGAFVLILLLILIVVLCRRRNARCDAPLMMHGEGMGGSYKNSITSDFNAFDNNGFAQDDSLTDFPHTSHKNHHHHHHPTTSSRRTEVERALGFYQSVPTLTTPSTQQPESTTNLSSDTQQPNTLPAQAQEEDWRGTQTVHFENPSYVLEQPSTSSTSEISPQTLTLSLDGTSPEKEPQPETSTPLDEVAEPETPTQPETRTLPEVVTSQDRESQPEIQETQENLETQFSTPLESAKPEDKPNYIYAVVNKSGSSSTSQDTKTDRCDVLDHADNYPEGVQDSSQQVRVSTAPNGTIITLTNNHEDHQNSDMIDGTDRYEMMSF